MLLPYISSEKRYGKTFASYAKLFRAIALGVDQDPDVIFTHIDNGAVQYMLTDRNSSTYERTFNFEALSYGDPGAFMTCPGPSLSGLVLRELGTEEQKEKFFSYVSENKARSFFALTEPRKGSDAGSLECAIMTNGFDRNSYFLQGEKCLFGNAAVGKIGVVFARTSPGPLGIRAVLVTPEMLDPAKNWIYREKLPMTAMRGAQIGYMKFNNCPVNAENILGSHKRPMEYGMMAVIKTFNRLRTGVGALAIGQAQAVLDHVYENLSQYKSFSPTLYVQLYYQLESARTLLHKAAKVVDENPFDSYNISVAKVQATKTAEFVISECISHLEPAIMIQNPWLAKCYRDCFAWEYMEGTSHMQYKNVYQVLQTEIKNKEDKKVVVC